MANDSSAPHDLLDRAGTGDQQALADMFGRYRARLKRMVALRLDRRLQGRVDPSDVLQETYLDLAKRASEFFIQPAMPFFLWLRLLTGQRLLAIHRQYLNTRMRDVGQEVALRHGAMPQDRPLRRKDAACTRCLRTFISRSASIARPSASLATDPDGKTSEFPRRPRLHRPPGPTWRSPRPPLPIR